MKILIIEDEPLIGESLKRGLENEGYDSSLSITGEDAYFRLNNESFDLVLLDWMLPGRPGIEILKAIRKSKNHVPVIMLTAKDDVDSRVFGLDTGADDYMVKPFAFPELLARIRSIQRKTEHKETLGEELTLKFSDLELDPTRMAAKRGQSELELTQIEYKLLLCLFKNLNQIVTRDMLATEVWNIRSRATPMDNVIDVHMNRLRKKVEIPSQIPLIRTVRGSGFMLGETV